mmetsp:Transcript_140301/g.364668  ORF Transcript_140301/g.364668 Transcript_140301/m.364668 type:complete len:206 (-) Transcript_140301:226-843(-)
MFEHVADFVGFSVVFRQHHSRNLRLSHALCLCCHSPHVIQRRNPCILVQPEDRRHGKDAINLTLVELRCPPHLVDVPIAQNQMDSLWILPLKLHHALHKAQGARALVTRITPKDEMPPIRKLQLWRLARIALVTPLYKPKTVIATQVNKVAEVRPMPFHVTTIDDPRQSFFRVKCVCKVTTVGMVSTGGVGTILPCSNSTGGGAA